MKKWALWGVLGLIIFLAASGGGLVAYLMKDSSPGKVSVSKPTPEEFAKQQITIAATNGLAMPPAAVQVVKSSKDEAGWIVNIEAKIASAELLSAFSTLIKTFAEVKRTDVSIAGIDLMLSTDALRDIFGRTLKDTPIVRIKLAGDTFQLINWVGFDPRNFSTVATDFWMHEKLLAQLPLLDELENEVQENKLEQEAQKKAENFLGSS